MIQDDIAVVDDTVKSRPIAVSVGGQQIHGTDIVERIVIIVSQLGQLVRAIGSPHDGPLLNTIVEHTQITAIHHLLNIGLLLPEIGADDTVGRIDGQEIGAAGKHRGDTAASQPHNEIFLEIFGNHNSQLSIVNSQFSIHLESYHDVQRDRLTTWCLRVVVSDTP